ncbi:hypothetical protein IWW39_004287 [Coemansia spiralis]|uniref:Uncharacterized protein n=1 Tax=Coemansia spiralis TaxID=417178 RepID=A0A9W8GGP5_9FUNG|nr:hypothetical protein IWW39_004287 [Coemansia spiralis]
MFYPDRKKQYTPKYRNSCNCDDCLKKTHHYGEYWRNQTPVCTCCDCMARAGQNIPHSYSTHNHVQASTHTCAMTGDYRHGHSTGAACCSGHHADEQLPKYSLTPHTTHKVDNACGSRYYATPLHPTVVPQHANYHHNQHQVHVNGKVYDERSYISMPNTYHPCNR